MTRTQEAAALFRQLTDAQKMEIFQLILDLLKEEDVAV